MDHLTFNVGQFLLGHGGGGGRGARPAPENGAGMAVALGGGRQLDRNVLWGWIHLKKPANPTAEQILH